VLSKANVYRIMRGGGAGWKIENETFNTLRNQGYNFEHNYGHVKKNFGSVFTYLMLLAFLIDQVQELSCPLFQKTLNKMGSRKLLWHKLEAYFESYYINSWDK
jgi:hypothetical protein